MDEGLIGRETPVHITKYDGSYHRRWPARFVLRKGPLYLVTFAAGEPICCTPEPSDDPDPLPAKYGGSVYLYDDRWFNISRMKRDGGTWYYVNIATPVEFDGASFHTVDLDLDISWFTDERDPEEPRGGGAVREGRGLKARATNPPRATHMSHGSRGLKARATEAPRVLDEDEFLDHSKAMSYPADVIEQARAAVDQVLGLIGKRAFPFDGT
ncbi:MAG: DUF402 domain-containing protein [Dehalococcoidia bacterium]